MQRRSGGTEKEKKFRMRKIDRCSLVTHVSWSRMRRFALNMFTMAPGGKKPCFQDGQENEKREDVMARTCIEGEISSACPCRRDITGEKPGQQIKTSPSPARQEVYAHRTISIVTGVTSAEGSRI